MTSGEQDETPGTDHGYRLRGGRQPDVSALTNVLAHRGADVTEPLIFLASGGIGAGYVLWEFTRDGSKPLVLGFRSQWQHTQFWLKSTVERLGLRMDLHTTRGARGAAKRLSAALDAGEPAIVQPDRFPLGYWYLPEAADGIGGHLVVAYAQSGDRVHLDDRNRAPLTVERSALDKARGRVGSAKNLLAVVRTGDLDRDRLADAVRSGLTDCTRRLAAKSTSFALPAWRKWATLLTDERAAKGWPAVFADRRGLVGALLSIWEGVDPAGMGGGHLRDLFADGLAEAAVLLDAPELEAHAANWRDISRRWREFADAALPEDVPEFGWMRGLTARVREGVTAGDAGQQAAAEAGTELWRLRAHYDAEDPFTERQAGSLFTDLGSRLRDIHTAETGAVAALSQVTTR
ncbi:protein of unknown function [Amycolatopsis marina]|uniref:Butirosin biosynthesis protein H, N-terminal n=1 Tax=Amycolatopsis marina TaxID=490629 RepID=A0A1I0XA84_9PSEU|nr:BtrH N-terminal domain-containing protein [Amycolatopsis marina]SFA97952.1 protein of unknown function [Amycolatopsis marina]